MYVITGESVEAGFSRFLFISNKWHPCCLGKPVSIKMFVLMHDASSCYGLVFGRDENGTMSMV